jgi:asparagine synthase (glutamine-hydrolysing)
MCGIAGVVDPTGTRPPDALAQIAATMAATLGHRGPDDAGTWADPGSGIALGFRRLAVVDPGTAGFQPMRSPSGRYVAVFNGEVYGYERLREKLDTFDRVRWRGHSDTEVLLAAVDRWGVRGALTRSNAMLAIAIWDSTTRTLTLARDRLGEKPLYYGWADNLLIFGSELKALRTVPAFDTTVDDEALALYLRHTFVPHPRTIFRSARMMPPGSLLEVQASDAGAATCPDPDHWWDFGDVVIDGVANRKRPLSVDAVDELDALLRDSVAIRSVADVPLGAFLSGGIDSSTVVALLHAAGAPPRTFTVAMPELGYDESAHARSVARHLGTDHTEIALSATDALAAVPRLATLYDEPFADPSALPTHLVSTAARRHVTVCLSGDGGDEVFGGYNRQVAGPTLWRRVSRLPRPVRRLAARAVLAPSPAGWERAARRAHRVLPRFTEIPNPGDKAQKIGEVLAAERFDDLYTGLTAAWPDPAELTGVDAPPMVGGPAVDGVEEHMLYLDTTVTLPDGMLTKVDRASMGASLEVRVPLLDYRVVELAWHLPYTAKVHRGSGKRILRQVLDRYVPRDLVERPKMGFDPPIDTWLRGPLRGWAGDLLDSRALADAGIDPTPVRRRWTEHQAGARNHGYALWTVLMYQSWRDTL